MPKEIEPKILKVICGAQDKPLKIGDIEIQCYVLEDETRVLSQTSLQLGIGMSASGASKAGMHRLQSLVRRIGRNIPELSVLAARIMSPIEFQPPHGGRTAFGYEATILADICEAVLSARKVAKALNPQQIRIADRCEMLMRGFARVGIIALVDQATGYDKMQTRRTYEEILRRFITPDLQKYTATFPDDFYYEMFRLKNWNHLNIRNRPGIVGNITVDIVYGRLAPNVLAALRNLTERDDKGRLRTRLYRHLTPEHGHPKLREHLAAVVALMKASPNWRIFYSLINRSLPLYNATLPLLLTFPEDEEELSRK